MLSSKCHRDLVERPAPPFPVEYFKSYETNDTAEIGNRNYIYWGGEVVDDTIAFCGQNALSFGDKTEIPLYKVEAFPNTFQFGSAVTFLT